jgi:hypothetical protein
MFETPEVFRNKIRERLQGTFSKEASNRGITTLSEVDPQGQTQPSGQPQGQQGQQQVAPKVDYGALEKATANYLTQVGVLMKAKYNITDKVDDAANAAKKSAKDLVDNIKKAKDANEIMKLANDSANKGLQNVNSQLANKASQATKQQGQNNQQQNQNQQQPQQGQAPQQMNAEHGHGNDLQVADESYGDGIKNTVSTNEPVVTERNDPISVDAMQGILGFATADQIGEAIKKMVPEDYQQFVGGLQKRALDILAKYTKAGSPTATGNGGENKNNNPDGSGGNTDKEGNLKLGDL